MHTYVCSAMMPTLIADSYMIARQDTAFNVQLKLKTAASAAGTPAHC